MTDEAGASSPAVAILPSLETPTPRLRVICTPVNTIDNGRRTLIADLFEPMEDAPASGWPFQRFA